MDDYSTELDRDNDIFEDQAARIAELEHEAAAMRNAAQALIDTIASGTHWEDGRPSIYNGSIDDLYDGAFLLSETLATDAGQRAADVVKAALAWDMEKPNERVSHNNLVLAVQAYRAEEGNKTEQPMGIAQFQPINKQVDLRQFDMAVIKAAEAWAEISDALDDNQKVTKDQMATAATDLYEAVERRKAVLIKIT